jgi:hypothetical protein
MKVIGACIVFCCICFCIQAQSSISGFKKLSRPERWWVIAHPFKAKKAFQITQHVQAEVDSIKKAGIIGTDASGGKLDAFKHAYWMACLSGKIGPRRARKLGIAHEKGNYLQFRKKMLEDDFLPDSVSTVMDLRNNYLGIELMKSRRGLAIPEIRKVILDAVVSGLAVMIKKDEQGNFIDCSGKRISMQEWKGKWNVPKCLVSSSGE